MPKPLTVNDAAAQMGVTGELLREALKQDKFPFGVAVKMERRWAYYINPVAFDLYLRGEWAVSKMESTTGAQLARELKTTEVNKVG